MSTADGRTANAAGPDSWQLRPWISTRTIAVLLAAVLLLAWSGERTEIGRLLALSMEGVRTALGLQPASQVSDGVGRIVSGLFPLQFAEAREIARIENFDPDDIPWGARVEVQRRDTSALDPRTLEHRIITTDVEVLIEPLGYLTRVLRLMLETIEIAAWGTLMAVLIALPLAPLGARNYTPHPVLLFMARSISSLLRAVPELISALLLVLVFGFGPIAGVVALGLHTAGFLGKFFADDIENAERPPQDALRAAGANQLKVLRFAVLPQVLPSYMGYVQYILERNIRTATVIGIVGAGGIGQELKGRFEMFHFGHVGTILLVIFVTVLALEYVTGRMRGRVM